MSLNTKLAIDANNVKYQWQASFDNAIYKDIFYADKEKLKVVVKDQEHYLKWYRCVINYELDGKEYTCITEPVELLDSRNLKKGNDEQYGALYNMNSSRNIDGILDGLYVSNDESAYILGKDIQYFNVLGKYNNGLKNYWISCSCDAAWAIYLKNNNDEFVSADNIKSVICYFDEKNNVVFNVKLKEKADVAVYTDTCIGRFPEIYYADGAAMKANLDNNKLQSIHMVANNNFADANLNDMVGFSVEPITKIDTFNIDAYLNGPYYKVKSNGNTCYEYIINDVNNEDDLTYEDIFEELKGRLFDYCYGINYDTYTGGNDPFVYRTINGKDVVVAIRSKDSVLSFSYKNVDEVSFKMNIGNAIDLGIDNTDIYNIKPSVDPVVDPEVPSYTPPKTAVN